MKILGNTVTKKVINENVRPVLRTVCDCCGKTLTGYYAAVTTSHRRWGYDSCESIRDHDYCLSCASQVFADIVKKAKVTDSFVCEVRDIIGQDKYIEVDEDGNLFMEDFGSCKIEGEED